jgi:hypothetical protein
MLIILEHNQLVALEQSVRGKAIDHVDCVPSQGLVLESWEKRRDRRRSNPLAIHARQTSKPVCALDEVGSKACPQV